MRVLLQQDGEPGPEPACASNRRRPGSGRAERGGPGVHAKVSFTEGHPLSLKRQALARHGNRVRDETPAPGMRYDCCGEAPDAQRTDPRALYLPRPEPPRPLMARVPFSAELLGSRPERLVQAEQQGELFVLLRRASDEARWRAGSSPCCAVRACACTSTRWARSSGPAATDRPQWQRSRRPWRTVSASGCPLPWSASASRGGVAPGRPGPPAVPAAGCGLTGAGPGVTDQPGCTPRASYQVTVNLSSESSCTTTLRNSIRRDPSRTRTVYLPATTSAENLPSRSVSVNTRIGPSTSTAIPQIGRGSNRAPRPSL